MIRHHNVGWTALASHVREDRTCDSINYQMLLPTEEHQLICVWIEASWTTTITNEKASQCWTAPLTRAVLSMLQIGWRKAAQWTKSMLPIEPTLCTSSPVWKQVGEQHLRNICIYAPVDPSDWRAPAQWWSQSWMSTVGRDEETVAAEECQVEGERWSWLVVDLNEW